jgi:hypothetical protein
MISWSGGQGATERTLDDKLIKFVLAYLALTPLAGALNRVSC